MCTYNVYFPTVTIASYISNCYLRWKYKHTEETINNNFINKKYMVSNDKNSMILVKSCNSNLKPQSSWISLSTVFLLPIMK